MASDGPITLDMNFFLAIAYSMIQKVFSQVKCKVPNGREGKFAADNLVVEFKG